MTLLSMRVHVCLFAMWFACSLVTRGQELTEGDPAATIAVLETDATLFEKAKACQQLAIIGDASAVPALAELLPHPQLTGYARYALEAIPGEASLAAMRDALSRCEGDALVGIIGSLGKRRDEASTDLLAEFLAEPHTRPAAAFALGEIGTDQSATELVEAMNRQPDTASALARGILRCAQRRSDAGDSNSATALYAILRDADVERHFQLAAMEGLIRTSSKPSHPLLHEALRSDDPEVFRMALTAVRAAEIPLDNGEAELLSSMSPDHQVRFLTALRDRGTQAVVPAIIEVARESDDEDVAVEAIRAVAALDAVSELPFLWRYARRDNERISEAARRALVRVDSKKLDEDILELLAADVSQQQRLGIDLAARRHLAAASPRLLALAQQRDGEIQKEATLALGETVRQDNFAALLRLALNEPAADGPAHQAVINACVRMPRKPAATLVAELQRQTAPDASGFLLDRLAQIGGETALSAVVDAARSNNDQVQDEATRVLGAWPTAEVAPALYSLAQTLDHEKYQIRALRGYIRVARQLDMTMDERLEVCRNALQLAKRTDEKKLVLQVLARHRAIAGLELATQLLDQPMLREQAVTVIVNVAERLIDQAGPDLREPLEAAAEATTRDATAERANALLAQIETAND